MCDFAGYRAGTGISIRLKPVGVAFSYPGPIVGRAAVRTGMEKALRNPDRSLAKAAPMWELLLAISQLVMIRDGFLFKGNDDVPDQPIGDGSVLAT